MNRTVYEPNTVVYETELCLCSPQFNLASATENAFGYNKKYYFNI